MNSCAKKHFDFFILPRESIGLRGDCSHNGHNSVVTTQIYAHLLPSSLQDAVTVMPWIGIGAQGENALATQRLTIP